MKEKDFLQKMEDLNKPEVRSEASQRQIRLAVLNAKKSAVWGVWLMVVPLLFLLFIAVKEGFRWEWGFAEKFTGWVAKLGPWGTFIVFLLLPAIGAIVNLLAIMHFQFDKFSREIVITIRLKWLNIILAFISICILGVVMVYGLIESVSERAIHRMERQQQLRENKAVSETSSESLLPDPVLMNAVNYLIE